MSLGEDFARAHREGRRRVGRCLLLWSLFRAESPPRASRLGLSVGRKHGSAVQRNLFKRRVRDAFRRNKDRIPRGWDFIVAPRGTAGRRFPPIYDDLVGDFLSLVRPPGKA